MPRKLEIEDFRSLASHRSGAPETDKLRLEMLDEYDDSPLSEASLVYLKDMCAPSSIFSSSFRASIDNEYLSALVRCDLAYFTRFSVVAHYILIEIYWGPVLSYILKGSLHGDTNKYKKTYLNKSYDMPDRNDRVCHELERLLVSRFARTLKSSPHNLKISSNGHYVGKESSTKIHSNPSFCTYLERLSRIEQLEQLDISEVILNWRSPTDYTVVGPLIDGYIPPRTGMPQPRFYDEYSRNLEQVVAAFNRGLRGAIPRQPFREAPALVTEPAHPVPQIMRIHGLLDYEEFTEVTLGVDSWTRYHTISSLRCEEPDVALDCENYIRDLILTGGNSSYRFDGGEELASECVKIATTHLANIPSRDDQRLLMARAHLSDLRGAQRIVFVSTPRYV